MLSPFKKVVVECDSSQAVQLLNDGLAASHNLALVRNILQLCGHGWDICIVHLPPHGLPIKQGPKHEIVLVFAGSFDSIGRTKLQDACKAGLDTIQGKNSAVLGTVLICK
ncbi:hypothetical protein Gotur_017721 [Gossypium turneri]